MSNEKDVRSTILKRDAKGVVRNGAEWLLLWSDPDTLKSREERRADGHAQKHRVELGQQLAAAARSLSGDIGLELAIGERAGDPGALKVGLDELSDENLPALRGRIDANALFLRFHDAEQHAKLAPEREAERRLFDLMEAVRCEAVGAAMFPGVAENLVAAHYDRLKRSDLLGAHLASLVPLAEALRMVVRDRLLGVTEPSIAASGFWMWDRWLRERLSPQLDTLAATRSDQAAYGEAALTFIDATFSVLESSAEGALRRATSARSGKTNPTDLDDGEGTDAKESDDGADFVPSEDIFAGDEAELPVELLQARADARRLPYTPFTTAHDQVVRAEALGQPEQLRQARQKLDQKRAEFRKDFARLVAQLQRRLMALQTRSWSFDLEEGLVDASRLDRVVVNPGFADAYKQEEESQFRDTAVTLLIDNSGSMRGKPIEIACVVADLVAAALEQCAVTTEVLGFTTGGWRGGRSYEDWARAGKPADPGRLNDLLHIVYKSADETLRRARNNLCVMLSNDVLKENVDGEALQWAARRLMLRPEARRVLIVISDGAPVEQMTLEINSDKQILDRHLRDTIGGIERGGQIELAAIGIKHDVGDYYRRAMRVEKIEDLGAGLVEMLDALVVR